MGQLTHILVGACDGSADPYFSRRLRKYGSADPYFSKSSFISLKKTDKNQLEKNQAKPALKKSTKTSIKKVKILTKTSKKKNRLVLVRIRSRPGRFFFPGGRSNAPKRRTHLKGVQTHVRFHR